MAKLELDRLGVRDALLPIITEAARRIRSHRGALEVHEKGSHDHVTQLDLEIETYLRGALLQRFPAHRIVGEETFRELEATDGALWLVDPLDGTSNVVFGLPPRAVSVALLVDGLPVVGAICDPLREEVFDAALGHGARLNNQPLAFASAEPLQAPFGASTGFLLWCEGVEGGRPLFELLRRFGKVRVLGSQALQLCYVAAGRLIANLSREAKIWDDAAGALIVQEAGGAYGDFAMQPIFPVRGNTAAARGGELHSLAAAPGIAEEIRTLLNSAETGR